MNRLETCVGFLGVFVFLFGVLQYFTGGESWLFLILVAIFMESIVVSGDG